VTVESSVFSGGFNQADATRKANEILKSAQSRANKIISDAKNPVLIAKAWDAALKKAAIEQAAADKAAIEQAAADKAASIICVPGLKCPKGSTGPGGGIVFYDAGSQQSWGRYLEFAPAGWYDGKLTDPYFKWATGGLVVDPVPGVQKSYPLKNDILGIGLGLKNSIAITAQGNGENTAAGVARAYRGGSQTDWFLPSAAELNLLCQWARNIPQNVNMPCKGGMLNTGTGGNAGFQEMTYWSSTESGKTEYYEFIFSNIAWHQSFRSGTQDYGNKSSSYNVRPIRSFSASDTAGKAIDAVEVAEATRAVAEAKAAADPLAIAKKAAAEKAAAEKAAADVLAAADAKAASFVCIPGSNCPIGSTGPGGGIVFYDAGSQQSWGRYLEFAPDGWSGPTNSADPRLDWCNIHDVDFSKSISDVTLKASIGVEIGKGKANTDMMVARCSSGAGYAARAYKGGNKNDWYLPSRDELNELCKFAKYQATGKVDVPCQRGTSLRAGFVVQIRYYDPGKNWYWSSSENGALFASIKDFSIADNGGDYGGRKGEYAKSVRPIRSF
jgi:hypothetical protein